MASELGRRAGPGRNVKLTRRQCEVAALVAAGKTNGEIGDALGISLDGAKYHVSELLVRLDVDSREDIGRYWERRNSMANRASGPMRVAIAGLSRFALAGVVTVAVAGGLVALWVGVNDDSLPSARDDGLATTLALDTATAPSNVPTTTPPVPPNAMSVTVPEAIARLDSPAPVNAVIDAVRRGDVDELLSLTQVTTLAFRESGPTPVASVRFNSGRSDIGTVRSFLGSWMIGNPGEVTLIGTSYPGGINGPVGPGNTMLVHIGFQFERGVQMDSDTITGLYVFVDPSNEKPVVEIWGLPEQSSSAPETFLQFDHEGDTILYVADWLVDEAIASEADFQRRVREAWAAEQTATSIATLTPGN